jgi:alpha-glucosidase
VSANFQWAVGLANIRPEGGSWARRTAAAEPWLPQPDGWGAHAIELQQQDPESSLALVTKALELRRLLWKNEVFGPNDGGIWRVEAGNLLICERSADFFVAVAMGTEPVQLPAGSVLLSAVPWRKTAGSSRTTPCCCGRGTGRRERPE